MRIGRYRDGDDEAPWCGVRTGDGIVHLAEAGAAAGVDLPRRTVDLLATWRWERKVALAMEMAESTGVGLYPEAEVAALAPVGRPGKIVCVGLNYRDHAEEGDNPIPDEPVLFAKFPTAVIGPGDPIAWDPTYAETVDYEAELVAVVGTQARNVDPAEAASVIAGYTVGNDVSARSIQHGDGQWVRGKSLDTFAPIGPEVVTTDAIDDVQDLDVWAELDGDRLQDSNTGEMIVGVAELVAFCSRAFTLEPGDLLFTGTPAGVGVYRDPPRLLEDGSTVVVGIEGIGELANPCTHQPRAGGSEEFTDQ